MLVKTYAGAVQGVDAQTITVEVNTGGQVLEKNPWYHLVGLPDSAVRESSYRIEAAAKNSDFPVRRVKTIINLAPADIRKEGAAYDLPIALAIHVANGNITPQRDLARYIIMGELSLDGGLRPIRGALPIAIQARKEGFAGLILPKENAREAAIVNDIEVFGVESLRQAADFLAGDLDLQPTFVETRDEFFDNRSNYTVDFHDVTGQENIKRALEIAAAGGHNIIMICPPGAGKTMLAKRLPSI